MDEQIVLSKLIAFKEKEKFAPLAWDNRGLNPSEDELCEKLESLFNRCASALINGVKSGFNIKQLKNILKAELKNFKSFDYDTEEKEFICDYFAELSKIVEVDFKENLNSWLYGSVLNTLFRATSFLKGKEKVVETLSQDCTKCGAKLETFILRKEIGIPDYSWNIIQCNSCNEYNLFSGGPDIKQLKFGEYTLTEQLEKSEYNEEEAMTRLKQIKFFRKM